MGRFTDFFKALAINPNVVDDKFTENELEKFIQENSDSAKRISDMENRLHVDVKKKVPQFKSTESTVKPINKTIKSQKSSKKYEREER